MEEKSEQHDVDQQHVGPTDTTQPSSIPPTEQSQEQNAPSTTMPLAQTASEPQSPRGAQTPQEKPRKSVQLPREIETRTSVQLPRDSQRRKSEQLARKSEDITRVGRRSTQLSRGAGRPSRDFDIRRDGPFGRPSITMVRRQSSLAGLQAHMDETAAAEAQPEDANAAAEAPDLEALSHVDTGFEPEPPPLNYSLWDRKWYIIIFWGLILIDCIAMPVGLYFGLWYGTNLSPNIVFSIVTAALGGVSIIEYFLRFWRLFKHSSTCRVIGARRMYLDWFHWNFSFGWIVIMIELIVGTIPTNPPIRLLAMPVTSMLYTFGTELLVMDTLRYFEIPAPCRISSIPKGSQLRPGIYSIIEDVCAVDGSGGTAYREALNKRYEASHVFRAMLRRLGAFWAFGAQGMAVVCTILIFTIQHEAAYVVGWAAPFVWAGVWVIITYFYVMRKLKEEKKAWAEEIAEKGGDPTTEVSQTESAT